MAGSSQHAACGLLFTHAVRAPCCSQANPQASLHLQVAPAGVGTSNGRAEQQQTQPALSITVRDPVKSSEKTLLPGVNGGHVTYAVLTRGELPGMGHTQTSSVRRRFRDFVVGAGPAGAWARPACLGLWTCVQLTRACEARHTN